MFFCSFFDFLLEAVPRVIHPACFCIGHFLFVSQFLYLWLRVVLLCYAYSYFLPPKVSATAPPFSVILCV